MKASGNTTCFCAPYAALFPDEQLNEIEHEKQRLFKFALQMLIRWRVSGDVEAVATDVEETLFDEMELRDFEQPLFERGAEEVYAPLGHYFCLRQGRLYELPFSDPQSVGQVLIRALDALKEVSLVTAFEEGANCSLVKKMVDSHILDTYNTRLAELGIVDVKI